MNPMESQDPIDHCLNRLNLSDNRKLKERAQYFYHQCSRVPPKMFNKGINSKPIITIHLACESLGISDFDQASATRLAMCTPTAYTNILKAVRKCLDIQPKVTLKTLGVALGCTSMIPYVEKFFQEFQSRYMESLSAANRLAANDELALPSWKGSAFYICSKALGARLEKESLAKLCSCTTLDLTRVAKTMEEHCKDLIVQLKQENTRPSRPSRGKPGNVEDGKGEKAGSDKKNLKRQRTKSDLSTGNDNAENTPASQAKKRSKTDAKDSDKSSVKSIEPPKRKTAVSGIVYMISGQHYKDTKRYRDYIDWRAAKMESINSL